ncbi:MAG: pre-16S rRNA-processing nuclease YqgF [Candidatus Eremiobacteraeota bacterium]|nr:pre-16S rRNA-processing nuclease YqgF [Candidatus Eremiobacteraeota bacterium]
MNTFILGIDPGTRKAGFAIVGRHDGAVIDRGIEAIDELLARAKTLVERHEVETIALGQGTNAHALGAALASLGVPVRLVDERETTLRARSLYFADHPPRGWRKLIPLGMQVPPRPIDDYAAVLIARRYLADVGEPTDVL